MFHNVNFDEHHELHVHDDPETGLRALVAIHRDFGRLSLGGCRMLNYASFDDALSDVLRLSRGMTYKALMSGVEYGGAKAVIMSVPEPSKREAVLASMARFVDRLGGRFATGVDVGMTGEDVAAMKKITPFMVGTGSIAPDLLTAHGVFSAIVAGAKFVLKRDDLNGVSVAISGLGKVGGQLADLLLDAGAVVIGADVNELATEQYAAKGVRIVSPETIHAEEVDIFAPCALGGILNETSIPQLRCAAVIGAANNQLLTPQDAQRLQDRGIQFAPDYICNAGGLIAVAADIGQESEEWAWNKLGELGGTLLDVFSMSQTTGRPTTVCAEEIAMQRLNKITSPQSTSI